jgi:demethoxyubiquinone hydroxylase (CLK1/Coq7/Cat5 family)
VTSTYDSTIAALGTGTGLREKLSVFIEDLKSLQSHDQSQKNHKLEQIAVLEERVREIDAEAAARKRLIQMEIDELRHQISHMDAEKQEIHDVIDNFQK